MPDPFDKDMPSYTGIYFADPVVDTGAPNAYDQAITEALMSAAVVKQQERLLAEKDAELAAKTNTIKELTNSILEADKPAQKTASISIGNTRIEPVKEVPGLAIYVTATNNETGQSFEAFDLIRSDNHRYSRLEVMGAIKDLRLMAIEEVT